MIACEPLPATYECLEWNAAAHRRWLEQHQHQQQQPAPSQGDVQRSRQVERSEQPSSSTGGGVCSSSNSVGSSRTGPPAPILALPVGVGSSAGGEAIFTFYPQAAGWSSMRPSSGEVHTGMAVFLDNALASPEAARAAGLGPLASAVGVWAHRWAPAWLLGAARWAVVAALLGGARQCRCRLVSVSQLILEHRLTAVDLLKVDVERAELDVLQGVEGAAPALQFVTARCGERWDVHRPQHASSAQGRVGSPPQPCSLDWSRGACRAAAPAPCRRPQPATGRWCGRRRSRCTNPTWRLCCR